MSILSIIILISWGISLIYWSLHEFISKNYSLFEGTNSSSKVAIIFLMISPLFNTLLLGILIYCIIRDYFDMRKESNIYLKQRKQKIESGIIKICDMDPYGEENWND